MKKLTLFILTFYRQFVSAIIVRLMGHGCRHVPTCSEYAVVAIQKHGALKGSFMAIKRVISCNPFVKPTFDPVE